MPTTAMCPAWLVSRRDPMERAGIITYRPITGDHTAVTLAVRQRLGGHVPEPVRSLRSMLVSHARAHRREQTRD